MFASMTWTMTWITWITWIIPKNNKDQFVVEISNTQTHIFRDEPAYKQLKRETENIVTHYDICGAQGLWRLKSSDVSGWCDS